MINCLVNFLKHEEFLHLHGEKGNSSWVWKGIELGLLIIQQHCCMEVNNGNPTRIWTDKWITWLNQTVEPLHSSHYQFVFVSELILTNSNGWDIQLLNILFSPENVERITRMQLSLSEEDILRWSPSKDDFFRLNLHKQTNGEKGSTSSCCLYSTKVSVESTMEYAITS